jgi:hypothetical protein
MGAGAPNRPLPPTPDEDANERTLMKRVRPSEPKSFLFPFFFRLFLFVLLFINLNEHDDPLPS